nr:uncharacterized protein LOC129265546 [Lytechinus pictus]
MKTSQSTSSLQLFTIKSNKPINNSKPDKGATASPQNTEYHQEETVNDDDDKRNVVLRRSVSLLDITTLDKDRMRDESEMTKVVTSAIEEEKRASGIEFKGFGDVGVQSGPGASSVSSSCSDGGDDHPNQDGDLQKSTEMEAEIMDTQNGKKEGGYMNTDDFNKLQQLEQKLNKSQATERMLHKANIGYQHDINNLTKTLEDECETRRTLHEELEASRKLCCELYENLLQERTHCRSTNFSEVERHLSTEALKFSLSDAAVQTEVEHVDFSIQTDENQLLGFESRENVSIMKDAVHVRYMYVEL